MGQSASVFSAQFFSKALVQLFSECCCFSTIVFNIIFVPFVRFPLSLSLLFVIERK